MRTHKPQLKRILAICPTLIDLGDSISNIASSNAFKGVFSGNSLQITEPLLFSMEDHGIEAGQTLTITLPEANAGTYTIASASGDTLTIEETFPEDTASLLEPDNVHASIDLIERLYESKLYHDKPFLILGCNFGEGFIGDFQTEQIGDDASTINPIAYGLSTLYGTRGKGIDQIPNIDIGCLYQPNIGVPMPLSVITIENEDGTRSPDPRKVVYIVEIMESES